MSQQLSLIDLKEAMPKAKRKAITQDMVDTINQLATDDTFRQNYQDNIIGFASVLQEGRYKITSYIDAVRYVSFRMMGNNKGTSYRLTFPERYQKFIDDGCTARTISGYSTAYSKGELVSKVESQSMIPSHIFNADKFQAAINETYNIMMNKDEDGPSFKVRTDAANNLMTALKPPETKKLELEIDIKENTNIADLRVAARELAVQQHAALASGSVNALDVAHSSIIIDHEEVVE